VQIVYMTADVDASVWNLESYLTG